MNKVEYIEMASQQQADFVSAEMTHVAKMTYREFNPLQRSAFCLRSRSLDRPLSEDQGSALAVNFTSSRTLMHRYAGR